MEENKYTGTLTAEDREDLRDAKIIEEFIEHAFWKTLRRRLERALEMRRQILETPLHMIPSEAIPQGDFLSRAAALENIKGAMIGLRTAIELPQRIVESRSNILANQNAGESNVP